MQRMNAVFTLGDGNYRLAVSKTWDVHGEGYGKKMTSTH
jgi:hypothetical protein